MRWIAGRYTAFLLTLLGTAATAVLSYTASPWWLCAAVPLALLAALGVYDLIQTRHAIRRNYPVLGNLRFLFEFIRPEIRQYFLEDDTQAAPFRARSVPSSTSAPSARSTSAPLARRKMSTATAMSGSTIPCRPRTSRTPISASPSAGRIASSHIRCRPSTCPP